MIHAVILSLDCDTLRAKPLVVGRRAQLQCEQRCAQEMKVCITDFIRQTRAASAQLYNLVLPQRLGRGPRPSRDCRSGTTQTYNLRAATFYMIGGATPSDVAHLQRHKAAMQHVLANREAMGRA